MNVRLTGDPSKASRITPSLLLPPCDKTQGERFYRAVSHVGDLDDDTRTFRAVVATNAPVKRKGPRGIYFEVLDPAGLEFNEDDDWPLLTDHKQSARETVGRVSDLVIDGPSIRATLRLGQADDIAPIYQRVKDGTLPHVSVGYQVLAWRESKSPDGTRIKTATRWRLLEVSLVPVPADRNATIVRSASEMPFDNPEDRDSFVENIRSLAGLSVAWADSLPEDADPDAIRAAAREALTQRSAPQIRIRQDHTDPGQIQTRAADALAFRMAGGDLPEASREFVNMSMRDLAADALTRSGVSVRGMSADDIFTRAHGTSDFPLLVSNAMGKVAAQAYQAAESPLKALARQRTLPNFKESTSIRLGEMGRLEEMTEHGEFKHTSRAESGESMSLKTFGGTLTAARALLINDDLGLLGDMTAAMGAAAAQTEAEELLALLTANPTLSDGTKVFAAGRGNYATTGSALSEQALSNARKAMRTVKGLDGKTIIDAKPKYLVVGPELETAAEKLLASIYATTSEDVAAFAGKLSLVVEPRLTGAGWYLLADPARVASLQYGYLAAAQGVQIQRQEAWDTLGLKYRAWLDFGCGWLDWRGAYHATGAA
ncbi:Mu-like prophage major head subunit gpT family protein [Thioclava sp. GXIMD4215]|uniref:phage major capsid protein n=1 Tax=Thioclava sp. GXIMD4215 TaxID=3131928 RepID=UPI003254C8A1